MKALVSTGLLFPTTNDEAVPGAARTDSGDASVETTQVQARYTVVISSQDRASDGNTSFRSAPSALDL